MLVGQRVEEDGAHEGPGRLHDQNGGRVAGFVEAAAEVDP